MSPSGRPLLVWLIAGLYVFVTVSTLFGLFMIYSGRVPLDDAERAYFASRTIFDNVVTVIAGAINLVAVVFLFRLRKTAVPLFVVGLALNVALKVRDIATTNWLQRPGSTTGLLGLGVASMVLLYSIWLKRTKVLR